MSIIDTDLIKAKITCPAMILADNRTANVIGRIMILTDSITTIKNINVLGQPKGTKCLNKSLIRLNKANKMMDVHIKNLKAKEMLKCLETAIV